MNLLDKRFRSKTSSAAPLPPVRLVLSLSKRLSSLNYANYNTVSRRRSESFFKGYPAKVSVRFLKDRFLILQP